MSTSYPGPGMGPSNGPPGRWLSNGPLSTSNGPTATPKVSMLPAPKKLPGSGVPQRTNHDRQNHYYRYKNQIEPIINQ